MKTKEYRFEWGPVNFSIHAESEEEAIAEARRGLEELDGTWQELGPLKGTWYDPVLHFTSDQPRFELAIVDVGEE